MTGSNGFDRTVSDWLHADAERRVPDHLDAVLRRTRTERQRPAWSSLERWLPMEAAFTRRVAPAYRPVTALAVAILVLLALMAALLLAGSQRPKLPPPFGPAPMGLTTRAEGGDIFLVDPVTKRQIAFATGPEWDSDARFSPDGTKLAFLRQAWPASLASLMVANVDGSDLRSLTTPLEGITSGAWSGDGSYIALASLNTTSPAVGDNALTIIDVRRGTSHVLDIDLSVDSVSWLPPNGQEIVFRGASALASAVWAVEPDGGTPRALTPLDGLPDLGYEDPVISSDGRLLAYWSWDDDVAQVVHVRDLLDGSTWAIPNTARFDDRVQPSFSPDGRHLLMRRSLRDGPPPTFNGVAQLVMAAPDGTESGIPLGPEFAYTNSEVPDLVATFSTDGSQVLLLDGAKRQLLTLPIDGRPGTVESWLGELPDSQRLALPPRAEPMPCPGAQVCR
jgi:dipeptidyl aminopeptidase/acylaminoacyl peptidase